MPFFFKTNTNQNTKTRKFKSRKTKPINSIPNFLLSTLRMRIKHILCLEHKEKICLKNLQEWKVPESLQEEKLALSLADHLSILYTLLYFLFFYVFIPKKIQNLKECVFSSIIWAKNILTFQKEIKIFVGDEKQ